ncbi:MAG: FAD-dependent monooxygenase [Candidatus Absconditabacterales bacterium]|nr:FAD-dependent monooxygenase [Candidatus Absconditabacterales bacterium]
MNTVIIGGGITGLLAACAARPYATSITLIDKHPDGPPCDEGRLLLCPDTCAHLSDIGILSTLTTIMTPLTTWTCTVGGMSYPDQPAGRGDYPYPLIVEEKKLWEALYKTLGSPPIERGTPTSIVTTTQTLIYTRPDSDQGNKPGLPSNQTTHQYDLLLGCDGAASWVREQLFRSNTSRDVVTLWSSQSLLTINRGTSTARTPGTAKVIVGDKTVDEYRCISTTQLIHNHYSYEQKTLTTDHYSWLTRQGATYDHTPLWTKQSGSHYVTNPVLNNIVLCGSAVMDLPLLGGSNANMRQLIPRIPWRYSFARSSSHPLRTTLGIEIAHSVKEIYNNYTAILTTMMQSSFHDRWAKIVYIWTKKTPGRIARLYSTMDTRHPEVGSYNTQYPLLIEALSSSPRIRIQGWQFFHGPHPGTLAPAGHLVLRANEPKVGRYQLLADHKPIILIFQGVWGSKADAHNAKTQRSHYVGDIAHVYCITNTYQLSDDDDEFCLGDHDSHFHRACAASGPCVYCIYPDGIIGRRSLGYRFHNFQEWRQHYRKTTASS